MNKIWIGAVTLLCSILLSACNDASTQQSNFTISSSVMQDGGALPKIYTCDGDSINPPISWQGAPEGTQAYAVIMHHNAPEGVHWYLTLYNLATDITHLDSDFSLSKEQGQQGTNSVNQKTEYAPPCSKGPGEKAYTFTVYALSEQVKISDNTQVERANLLDAIKEITLASAEMTVTYQRNETDQKHAPKPPVKNAQPAPQANHTQRCQIIENSINQAGFAKSVQVTCDQEYAYVASSTYPDHQMMTGITGTNEQVPVPALGYAAPIKLHPQKATEITTIDAAVGVAVNGVPIYDYSSQGELSVEEYDPAHDTLTLGQLDICGGHSGRGDDYHYHVSPTCMIDTMKNQGSDAIIGWGYDGYPLYGNENPDGSTITEGTLDVCNGQADPEFGYRYHTSTKPPYIIQCLVGDVDTSQLPRVAPLSGDTQGIRANLKPPADGVDDLQYTTAEDGSRSMRYTYQGESYFTTYRASEQGEQCYDFEQKTISNGGQIEHGTFCRDAQPNEQKVNHQ
ncbi:YbhB/YbcL family Raf kinase inhibitor-like protein [Psychromonas sp. 14N.309.X.WAT.B.A12]|uniref:YbhB/YbcL family Raf kinase inhibitor-like protein n=1 Tax=unclassified Psychromonas TaxID=2614957 RepID=UPI0025AF8FDD|nr:YbhB/YbcL family Raf kinase inhibitor-like protein [Psychromonas sp. 14N.309.X.WAT.B.A12]MDN2662589.1 YbhB/YbcL family Raf kinase inhibitor-like protein [Psychromonas sp. 14N.309.X.WAT.B.A12]